MRLGGWRTRAWVLAAALALSPGGPAVLAGDKPPAASPPSSIPRSAEFQSGVDRAIDRGVAWLRDNQAADGSFAEFPTFEGATTALAYHTLRVCGVPREDPSATRVFTAARRLYSAATLQTYGAAVYLMAIAEHGDRAPKAAADHDVKLVPDDLRWAEEIARRLASGQGPSGAWGYTVADPYRPVADRSYWDHSNTQYALLGLKAAARCGVRLDPSVWTRALTHLLAQQEADGPAVPRDAGRAEAPKGRTSAPVADRARGWRYEDPARDRAGEPKASMTSGGVSSVVICRSELAETKLLTPSLDAESARAVWDGLAWLGTRWTPRFHDLPDLPDDASPHARQLRGVLGDTSLCAYEYYGVERAGVLAGVERMAALDWYGAGADVLVRAQSKDGSWRGTANGLHFPDRADEVQRSRRVVDTCFALLFLKRGTRPVLHGGVTRPSDDTDLDFALAEGLEGRDFEDFVDSVLLRWRRATDDAVKRRLFDGATSTGPRLVEPLLVRMDARDAERRTAVHALLRHATGLEFGYDPAADDAARAPAVAAWRRWWVENRARLVYDRETRRIVAR